MPRVGDISIHRDLQLPVSKDGPPATEVWSMFCGGEDPGHLLARIVCPPGEKPGFLTALLLRAAVMDAEEQLAAMATEPEPG